MQFTNKKIMSALKIGIILWIIGMLLVGFLGHDQDGDKTVLYIPMVITTGIVSFIVLYRFINKSYWDIITEDEWVIECAVLGIIVMAIQFIIDIPVMGLVFQQNLFDYFFKESTVMVMYPSIIAQTIIIGYLKLKK